MRDRIANALEQEFIRKVEEAILKINPERPLIYSNKEDLKLLPQIPQKQVWMEYAIAVLKELNYE